MHPSVTKVTPCEDFTLLVSFANGEEGVLDMKPHLGFGVFRKIADYAQFKTARVSFDTWSDQIRQQGALADSLDRIKRGLEREASVYQTTFDRFASLLEEARIARVQAAGDIQIVSRAVAPRAVARGAVKKAAIASIVGLMASVMLAFLLEYVGRSREAAATKN